MVAETPASLVAFIMDVYRPYHLGIDDGTIEGYCVTARLFQEWAGRPLSLDDMTEKLLLDWLNERLHARAPKTVKRDRAAILSIWRWAADNGHCQRPPGKIPTVRVPRKKPVSWRPEEAAKAISMAYCTPGTIRGTGITKADWWGSLLTFLYWVGPRIGAALEVRTSDLDLGRGIVVLRGEVAKTDEEQVLRLHPQAIAAIAKHYDNRREYVWPWPYNPRKLWIDLEAILRRAGLPWDRRSKFHKWRKTCYTLTAKAGGIAAAGRQLGHKTDMSRYYLDPTAIEDVQAADLMPVLQL